MYQIKLTPPVLPLQRWIAQTLDRFPFQSDTNCLLSLSTISGIILSNSSELKSLEKLRRQTEKNAIYIKYFVDKLCQIRY